MTSVRDLITNRWFKFIMVSLIYVAWFVLWSGYLWMLLGLVVIYDVYISKLYLKLFWNKHQSLKESSSSYRGIAGWAEAIIFALVFASLLRTYFFEMYVIPTGSMERTLMIGDYLAVSKVTYGPKMPNTPVALPLVHNVMPWDMTKKSYSSIIELPFKRIKGFRNLEREDIVVFNYPEGDSVALIAPQSNYYQLLRSYGREQLESRTKVIAHPVDRRDNYIKRAVAVAGDNLQVIDGYVYIDGKREKDIDGRQFIYTVKGESGTSPFTKAVVEELELSPDDIFSMGGNVGVFLTDSSAKKVASLSGVTSIERYITPEPDADVFPHNTELYPWNCDNMGPLWVPQKGATAAINLETLPLYRRIIEIYEGNKLEVKDDVIYINDKPADSYTFNMDYYFMMGDNRHNSLDSRFWGFVPEDHIVGTPSLIWLSLDENKSFPANIRFNRMFKSVK